ncbi:PTB domain-containing engulfment adapter protein 1 isoform X5 [Onychomys torridus]|uniref:PTB domain-containing engulfment adapter protein 1 isoform X5 n=1 Tax=Onychomys torridus TaxID=38674 RepID=UPI00167F6E4E|nr:PTB domain-containing engulfment adapter protein 1 isoform X5 [Onychomys torridus]
MNRAFSRKKDKTWMHTPEALSKHYIPYNAKFLGSTEVEQPKGTEVVRDAVRKLKFARHIKKSEGQKIPKVELQISIYGVKILEPKTKEVQHNCQLHRISFCADDKTDKRIFTFICKDSESNKHLCYVFDSEKCAEEITLTIGQAFDLAYRKFLESGGKDVETRKQIAGMQKRQRQQMLGKWIPMQIGFLCNSITPLFHPTVFTSSFSVLWLYSKIMGINCTAQQENTEINIRNIIFTQTRFFVLFCFVLFFNLMSFQ